ncbi:MAG TPA: undecaprenyldiphospho-muramoylpentapeptide beta-N-acetylglucosaminyltransferase [Gammaproteobacteria bacterium]|nr:undecaprenyldiphospho-muramoylpentapeptide beta-N-acetylglucosaminyltransferase [Gammaproteobacteria bacterium]
MRIVIMAGGTGGHVFPALAVAEVLRARGHQLIWMGTQTGLEARVAAAAGIPIECINVVGVRGKGMLTLLKAPFTLLNAIVQACTVIRRFKPQVALGMGGYASGPGGLGARLLGCPLVLHEQNAVPGMTNRVLSHVATQVLEGFPGSFVLSRHARYVGNPVRAAIVQLAAPEARFAKRSGNGRLLVIGGSQGARVLNENAPLALARLETALRPEVWHQTGFRDVDKVSHAYHEHGITARVTPFIEDIGAAYGWADLVLCRAGALTVSELAAAGVGAVLVPFAAAVDDHQTRNAAFLVAAGAAELLPESVVTPPTLGSLLTRLLGDRDTLLSMAKCARTLAKTDAAEKVADACQQAGRLA